jgi:hypothetical protein
MSVQINSTNPDSGSAVWSGGTNVKATFNWQFGGTA